MKNNSHLTAFRWHKPSQALVLLLQRGLVIGRTLDYGSGHGRDYNHLTALQYNVECYDPYYAPKRPSGQYDTILCTFVLNVLELPEREQVIKDIDNLLTPNGIAYYTVQRNIKKLQWSVRHTFQDYVILPLPIIFQNSKYCIYEYRKGQQLSEIIGEKNFIGGVTAADKSRLRTKEAKTIKFIQTVAKQYFPLFLAYSGGKDSEVLLHLARKAKIEFVPYYNNTTIDWPGTISWVKKHEPEIMINQPQIGFFDLIRHRGFPSAQRRFCCEKLKEKYVASHIMTGVRRDESKRRKQKYKEPEICWDYKNKQQSQVIMPLLDWTENDIRQYIEIEHIQCHPKYYDKNGRFNVKQRVGCLACPLRNDHGKAQFMQYPRLVRLWCRAMAEYRNSRTKLQRSVTNHIDEYEAFLCHVNGITLKQLQQLRKTPNYNPREMLQKQFNIELPNPTATLETITAKLTSQSR